MRTIRLVAAAALSSSVAILAASTARADDAPPPAPAAPMPAPGEADRAVAGMPAEVPVDPRCSTCDPCAPCGRAPCFQLRDACGWPLDSCGERAGCLYVSLEGGIASYSSPDGLLGELVGGNTDPLSWNGVDYDWTLAARLTVGYRYAPFHHLELRATWYGNPDADETDSGFFGATPGALGVGDLSRPVDADFSADAEAWSVELMWWNELLCEGRFRLDWGLGARYLSFDETAHVDFVTTGPGPFPVANGFVDSDVENTWWGLETGVALHVDVHDDLEAYGSFKALFGSMSRDANVSDDSIFAGGPHSASASDDEIEIGADLEIGVRWKIARHITVTGAYNLLVLDGVQRAEDAFDFSHSTTGAVQAKNDPTQLVIETLFVGVTIDF
jgi:hypothetical protein